MSLQNLLGQNLLDIKAKSLSVEGGSLLGGQNNILAGASTLTVLVPGMTSASGVLAQLTGGDDTTATSIATVVPSAGQFVVTVNANATANKAVSWIVTKL